MRGSSPEVTVRVHSAYRLAWERHGYALKCTSLTSAHTKFTHSKDTYIRTVSKGSVEGLLGRGKQVLNIIQTLNFELLWFLLYHFPKEEEIQPPIQSSSFSKSMFLDRSSPSHHPVFLVIRRHRHILPLLLVRPATEYLGNNTRGKSHTFPSSS